MDNTVKVKIVGKYGNALAYPINETAQLFCKIAGKKTLTKKALEVIQLLGFKVVMEGYTLEDMKKD